MARPQDNARYEAKQKANGWVRGPRISADAAEQLRELAHTHRLTPAQVVTRLILQVPLGDTQVDARSFDSHGFSAQEQRDWEERGYGR